MLYPLSYEGWRDDPSCWGRVALLDYAMPVGWWRGSGPRGPRDLRVLPALPHVSASVVISSRRGWNPGGPTGGVQGTQSRLAPRPSAWQPSWRAVRRSPPPHLT
jgi:hypothetical protein